MIFSLVWLIKLKDKWSTESAFSLVNELIFEILFLV